MKIKNILFLHSPRTGGTNFEKILGFKGHEGVARCGTTKYGQDLKHLMGGGLTHSSYEELIEKKLIPEKNNLIKVSILRNPFFRVLSLYRYGGLINGGAKKWGSFEEFLLKLKEGLISHYFYRPQFEYIKHKEGVALDDYIRFSNYSEDMKAFSDKYDLNLEIKFSAKMQHENTIKNCHEFYSKKRSNVKLVQELYKEDFENLKF